LVKVGTTTAGGTAAPVRIQGLRSCVRFSSSIIWTLSGRAVEDLHAHVLPHDSKASVSTAELETPQLDVEKRSFRAQIPFAADRVRRAFAAPLRGMA